MLAFTGFTLSVATLMGALSMAFVYAVEDEFFDALLRTEAQRQRDHRDRSGRYTEPVLPFVRLYAPGQALPPDLAGPLRLDPQRREIAGTQGRHYHLRPLAGDGSLLVAEVGGQLVVRTLRADMLQWLLAATAGLCLGAVALAFWLSRRTSGPLAALAGRVATSTPDALPEDLARGLAQDEIGDLARHLDTLHRRTRAFIERERRFTADVSHELRTPLAVISLAADRLHGQSSATQRPLLHALQAAAWQLQQTVELMLALAREAAPSSPGPQVHRLLPMLEQLLLAHAPLLDREGLEVSLDVPADLTRPWSPALTQLLVGHLLANAMAHRQSPHVHIHADAHALAVCNTGPPPPDAVWRHESGMQPDARGIKGAASTGLGHGLSIVRRLADRHGLRLDLTHHDGRTCAVLRDASPHAPPHGPSDRPRPPDPTR
ncbi:sensor histidine kinase [Ideonella sp.]|uniref:sensor histidine kinase n=1 Tax=Ideonella sp. TaxID=1929293 RepID=UPI0035AFD1C6